MTDRLPLASDTIPMWSYAESLGVDPNALVDAFREVEKSPEWALGRLVEVRESALRIEERAVQLLRERGVTWDVIAAALGISRVQAMRRHAARLQALPSNRSWQHRRRYDAHRS